jgi:hypothetical protein
VGTRMWARIWKFREELRRDRLDLTIDPQASQAAAGAIGVDWAGRTGPQTPGKTRESDFSR